MKTLQPKRFEEEACAYVQNYKKHLDLFCVWVLYHSVWWGCEQCKLENARSKKMLLWCLAWKHWTLPVGSFNQSRCSLVISAYWTFNFWTCCVKFGLFHNHFLAASSVLICQLPARRVPARLSSYFVRARERGKASRVSWVYTNPGEMHSVLLPALLRLSKSPQARGSEAGNRPV